MDGGLPLLFSDTPRRLPPSNVQAEQALLGALLSNNKAMDRCDGLEPAHFADSIHGRIFEQARKLISAGRVADPVTLKNVFEGAGILDEVGGPAYLVKLLTAMVGILNVGDYAKAIRDCSVRRDLIEAGERLVNAAFGEDPGADTAAIAMEAIARIDEATACAGTIKGSVTTLDKAMDAALEAMKQAQERGGPAGISTGFRSIDTRLGGLEGGLVYVMAGRPGMGKSSIAHQIAMNIARAGIPVHEFALEMSAGQLGRRTLCAAASVPLAAMKNGHADNDQAARLVRARKELAGLPLTIDDAGGQTANMISTKIRAHKRKHGLGLIMIDHLNLLKAEEADARHGGTWATGRASNTVLQVAKDSGCPVLLLSQLNRGPEGREDKRPNLSDLRQAGDIEQDAYAVGFIYRAEYYLGGEPEKREGETPDKHTARVNEWDAKRREVAGKAELIWAKVRDGSPGTDKLTFHGPTTSFGEDDSGR